MLEMPRFVPFFPVVHFLIKVEVQCATSLSVCNLLVLVTFLYRQIRGSMKETAVSVGPETVTHHTPTGQSVTRTKLALLSPENCSIGAARTNFNVYSIPPPPYDLSPAITLPNIPPRCCPVEVAHEPSSISEFAQATHVVSYLHLSRSTEAPSSPSAISKSIPENIQT